MPEHGSGTIGPGGKPGSGRWRRRFRLLLVIASGAFVVLFTLPSLWVNLGSRSRIGTAVDGTPVADVVIVFGAQVTPGKLAPMPFLEGRLDVGARLLRDGRAKAMLISGNARSSSGDEVTVMHDYLLGQGVDPARIVVDPYGLDTYDTCRRAHDVYGVERALLVSQALHLPRAITLCRRLGIDAYGVQALCRGCRQVTIWHNTAREFAAGPKAAWEALRHRGPTVKSPPDPALIDAAR